MHQPTAARTSRVEPKLRSGSSRRRVPATLRGRLLSAFGLAVAGVFSMVPPALAVDDYPSNTVKIIVPFSPGAGTDLLARTLAQKLSEKHGQNFVVQNVPGAGGTIGAGNVARAAPDGYTLLVYHVGMISAEALYRPLPFDMKTAFQPIARLAEGVHALVVSPEVKARTFDEFLELARTKPGGLNYGSSGVGGSDHLAAELLQQVAGIKATHIPYKGGGPAVIAAASGEVDFYAGSLATSRPLLTEGRLRGLLVAQPQRSAIAKDIPSASEAGIPSYSFSTWLGLWGPAGVPPAIVAELNASVREILGREEVRTILESASLEPVYSSAEDFDRFVKAEFAKWSETLESLAASKQ